MHWLYFCVLYSAETFNFFDIDVNKQSIILYSRPNMFIMFQCILKWNQHQQQHQYTKNRSKLQEPMFAHCVCCYLMIFYSLLLFVFVLPSILYIHTHFITYFIHSCRFFGFKQFYSLICKTSNTIVEFSIIRFESLLLYNAIIAAVVVLLLFLLTVEYLPRWFALVVI